MKIMSNFKLLKDVRQTLNMFMNIRALSTKNIDLGNGSKEPQYQVVFGEEDEEGHTMLKDKKKQNTVSKYYQQKKVKKGAKRYLFDTKPDIDPDDDSDQPDDSELEGYMNVNDIKVPILPMAKKIEIYELHKQNPNEWNEKTLAKKYNMSVERSKAIIYLMKLRFDAMEKIKPFNISEKEDWEGIFDLHQKNPSYYNAEFLSKKYNMPVERINDILSRMADHSFRQFNMDVAEEFSNSQLDTLESVGVDVSFKESKIESKLEKYYYPQLFGDDDLQYYKEDLSRKIIKDTKAKRVCEFPSFIKSHETRKANDFISNQPEPRTHEDGYMYKAKLAYRDLSISKTPPTIIRTRSGM